MPATIDPEDFWRKQINELSASLPDDGKKAPELEAIKPRKPIKEGNQRVMVQKIITHVYVFTDTTGKMYASNTSQKMQILGTMSLNRAIRLAQEDELP